MKQEELILIIFSLLFVACIGGLIVKSNMSADKGSTEKKRYKGAKHAKRNRESWDLD